jgi:hypothetical protein
MIFDKIPSSRRSETFPFGEGGRAQALTKEELSSFVSPQRQAPWRRSTTGIPFGHCQPLGRLRIDYRSNDYRCTHSEEKTPPQPGETFSLLMVLTNSFIAAIIKIQRALPVDGWPQTLSYEVTAGLAAGRLLLFINVDHKVNHHDNQHTELNKIRPVEIHKYHPPLLGVWRTSI